MAYFPIAESAWCQHSRPRPIQCKTSVGMTTERTIPPTADYLRRDASLRMLAFGIAFLALAGSLLVSFWVTPESLDSGAVALWPTCWFRQIFGMPCPTCGLTRAFAAISHGQLDDALRFHAAALWVYAAFWLGAVASCAALLRAAHERYGRLRKTAPRSH